MHRRSNPLRRGCNSCAQTMTLVRHWIRSFPDAQKEATADAVESASLAKIRRALRLLEDMDQDQRGPILDVELLSTFNLEPILPVIQFALNCIPSRARLRLAPLDAIEARIFAGVKGAAPCPNYSLANRRSAS